MAATLRASSSSSSSSLLFFFVILSFLTNPSFSAIDSFVFGGCSQLKFTPGSPYESSINSLLTSLVNSAMSINFNSFTIKSPISGKDTVYGLFQCRGDLQNSDCGRCVARAVSQVGTLCLDATGGALQLEGCFVKYDNVTFLGAEDKTVVVKKCGPSIAYDSDALTRREAVMGYLAASSGTYRVGGSGNMQGMAQCIGDLSVSECQDCLSEAIGRLKTECGPASWGDMYLAKCYARYTEGGDHSHAGNDGSDDNDDNDTERTLAILIGLIAAVALLILFLSFLRKVLEKGKGCK